MLAGTDLRGILCAAITPVTPGLQIDSARLARHCTALLDAGCAFISTFGTTGEGASFSSAEKVTSLEALAAAGIPMARLVPAVMTPGVEEAAIMLKALDRLGCRAALILPPFYYGNASEEGIVEFFDAMLARAGATDIDLLLYNIPQLSRIAFTPSLIRQLLARFGKRIVGLKDSTGNADNGEMLVRTFPELSIFTGDDRVLPRLLAAGGAGMIGGLPNVFARDLRKFYDAPTGPGADELKRQAALRIVSVDGHGGLLALKAILARLYDDAEFLRPMVPLVALSAGVQETVLKEVAATGFVYERAAA